MKNRTLAPLLIIVCWMIAPFGEARPQSPKTQHAPKRIRLTREPELGMKLPFKRRSAYLLMTGSGGLEPAYEVTHKGVEFTVCAYEDRLIHHVTTNDIRFRTPEGVSVEHSLEKVLEISKGKLVRERGWAFFVPLKSGWNAAFVQGDSMTDGELSPDAKVSFLFKR